MDLVALWNAFVAHASLQRPTMDQILTPAAFYDFCYENIANIKFGFAAELDHKEELKILGPWHSG